MANDDIFFENDVIIDVELENAYIIDQGAITKVVARKYSSESVYDIGDYVIYRNELYKCIADISTPEEFDPTKWTKLFVVDELKNIYNILPTKADKSATYTKIETDNLLNEKADKSVTYTKTETDNLLNEKADKSVTYTKTETDNLLNNKANKDSVYTKTEIQDIVDDIDADISDLDEAKADKATTYTKEQVDAIINNLPAPMIFKGTLGTGGTIASLPTASSENEGFTYKVITEGTYTSVFAKVGDMFTSNGSEWVHIPSGDETFTDTWRGIKVNGAEKLGSSINTGSVDFKNGTNSTVIFDPSDSSIKFNVDGYTQAQVDTKLADKANASDVYAKSETYSQAEVDSKLLVKADSSDVYTKQETYTKTEVNTLLSEKADTSTVTTALALKADKADTYTKEEVDDKFDEIDPIGTATGNPCTFETNLAAPLNSLKCEITAKQDLHGYDHPWAGGGGKNKTDIEDKTISEAGYVIGPYPTKINSDSMVLSSGDYTFSFNVSNAEYTSYVQLVLYHNSVECAVATIAITQNGRYSITAHTDTEFDEILLFANSTSGGAFSKFQLEAGNTATEYEPYSNICPIVGHSELNLTRCGKNLHNLTPYNAYTNIVTFGQTRPNWEESALYFPVGTYTFSIKRNEPDAVLFFGNMNGAIAQTYEQGATSLTFTVTTAGYYSLWLWKNDIDINDYSEPQVEVGSTATAYEPYNGQTFTVVFGQTVYGGVYDKAGRLTIDTVKVVINGTQPIGMTNWHPNTNTRAWIYLLATFPDLKDYEITDLNISSCKLKSDKLQTVTYQETNGISSNDIPSISIVGGDYWSIVVRVDDTTLETEAAINNYLSQNPIEVCYELATPIVIDVPSISVFAENGVNNITSDTGGDVTAEYFKGMAEGIEKVFKNSNFVDLFDIPDLPNIDGSYRLNLTITNGVPIYSWEKIT